MVRGILYRMHSYGKGFTISEVFIMVRGILYQRYSYGKGYTYRRH